MAPLNSPWLKSPLPEEVTSSQEWLRILQFFLIESPCPGLSHRQNDLTQTWGNCPWFPERHLKTPLNRSIFGTKDCSTITVAKNKNELPDALSKQDLPDDFFNRIDLQRAAYVRSSKKGNSSIYMGLFHHIRNALAHARFSLKRNSNSDVVFIFEDGTINEKNKAFDLTARGILKLKSLIAIMDILERGPDQQPDIEEQILAAIESGVNTKQRIKNELGIDNDDWITYSQVLRKEGKITYEGKKWILSAGTTSTR